ncbi:MULTISPECIES: 4Fe-4S binding protein [Clostridium]|uniref:4Fe-4S binding protein n=1 Tax=Clostridium TaxID=1485 RepID=UPI0003FC7179|nr:MULTISPECIES: 4Fe-4S binding protein [Clostridium]MDB2109205.1 4Fe-4S binding protein [Clostridium paraputrificum]MDC0800810.1 4Fe-4S binding protein [Clostridium paraputrificum]MDU1823214.1 4Fe-4S binding protein [Clostridium sp.]MDU1840576.1 4Fe-4S binding protein [Clostridium sp.]MDU2690029.1 4Fe-4S binding protein [Clostridium sp.]
MAKLNVNILGMEFNNPIFTAAGPGAKDGDLCVKAVEGGAGGLVTKTISVDPAPVPRPCMAKTNSGFLNTELWSELPKEQWIEKEYKRAKSAGVPMIVSMGYKAEDIEKIAPLVKPYADAVELSTHYVGTDVKPIVDAMKAAKKALDCPVFMKMSPHTDIQTIAKALEDAGADGLVMINSFGPCMSIDLETGYPIMGSQKGYGWLSGAPIRPLAVRNIYDASRVVNIPIIGVGGVTCGRDAAEMLMAGASAVEVCTEAILKGPGIYGKIAKELNAFLDEHGYKDVKEIIGLSHKKANERTFRTEAIPPVVDNDKCIKCGQCRVSCVYDAITIEEVLKIDEDKCFGCGLCVTRCPKGALTIQYK